MLNMNTLEKAERVRVVRSPYRICPLGAHIDHQIGPEKSVSVPLYFVSAAGRGLGGRPRVFR